MTFKSEPPTKPGAYWWKPPLGSSAPQYQSLVEVTTLEGDEGSLICFHDGLTKPMLPAGLWSSRLQPEDEIENAFREGCSCGFSRAIQGLTNSYNEHDFSISRAKQVVEGEV